VRVAVTAVFAGARTNIAVHVASELGTETDTSQQQIPTAFHPRKPRRAAETPRAYPFLPGVSNRTTNTLQSRLRASPLKITPPHGVAECHGHQVAHATNITPSRRHQRPSFSAPPFCDSDLGYTPPKLLKSIQVFPLVAQLRPPVGMQRIGACGPLPLPRDRAPSPPARIHTLPAAARHQTSPSSRLACSISYNSDIMPRPAVAVRGSLRRRIAARRTRVAARTKRYFDRSRRRPRLKQQESG